MKIVRDSELVTHSEYSLEWTWEGMEPGNGFGFPCDPSGEVELDALYPAGRSNYEACLTGQVDGRRVIGPTVRKHEWTYREPAIGLCDHCGDEVVLSGFTNTCECGADYNGAGQRLAPREQWGEETGETAADILAGGQEDW
jgi:hypothetical protein